MINVKGYRILILVSIASCLISSGLAVFFTANVCSHTQFKMLSAMSQELVEKNPELEREILKAVKGLTYNTGNLKHKLNFLQNYGFQKKDFLKDIQITLPIISIVIFVIGCIAMLCTFLLLRKQYQHRISELTEYLEKVNSNRQGAIMPAKEDIFSHLQDELYKTVTSLYQTRDAAFAAKENFANNLANIAHQLKTPITAASISIQLLEQKTANKYTKQISRQLTRLNTLEESLLLLSGIDAGTIVLAKEPIDIFTVLNLAADNLNTLLQVSGITIDVPNKDCPPIIGDLDWTMEAFMNLFKNCAEHSPANSTIHCDYTWNPLYTEILIWDEGTGFLPEDIPHLFQRFYRGKSSTGTGIGIGLSISKAILEMENGHITACNRKDKGACFEVRMYSH